MNVLIVSNICCGSMRAKPAHSTVSSHAEPCKSLPGRQTGAGCGTRAIADLDPTLRRWGSHFRTGNAAKRFNPLDSYVWRRLKGFMRKRKGRNLTTGDLTRWDRDSFWSHGFHRLRGMVRYPEAG
jgi:hypothetical protein